MFIRFLNGYSRFCFNAEGADGAGGSGGGVTQTPAPAQPATPAAQPTGAEVPNTPTTPSTPATPATPPETTPYKVPDAYKDKPWAAHIKSEDDLYKQFDGVQELIGKKTIQPIDYTKATPEEIAAHHAKSAPQDIAAYKFAVPDDPTAKAVGEAFKQAGVNEFQGQEIVKALSPFFEKMDAEIKAQALSEEGYMKLSQAAFGENFKAALGKAESTIKANADEADQKVFDEMPNEQRIAVDKTVNKIVDKYEARIAQILKEHGIHETGAQGNGGESKVVLDLTAQRAALRAEINAVSARPHTAEEKQVLIEKLNDTYKQK